MVKSLIIVSIILTSLFLPKSVALIDHQTTSSCSTENSLACQLDQTNLRISRLESLLGEKVGEVNGKTKYLTECEKKIEQLSVEVDRLKTKLSSFGDAERIKALEDEVRLLWEVSRGNNFEVHSLEQKALEADKKFKELGSKVEEMNEVVSEQWIQIKHLDQAVYMAEVRMAKVTKEFWRRCPLIKFFMDLYDNGYDLLRRILDPYAPTYGPVLFSCKYRALRILSAVKRYHHQLQGIVRHMMNSNELTAGYAHEEVVFFVASAVVAFPIMAGCMLLLSQHH